MERPEAVREKRLHQLVLLHHLQRLQALAQLDANRGFQRRHSQLLSPITLRSHELDDLLDQELDHTVEHFEIVGLLAFRLEALVACRQGRCLHVGAAREH